MELATQVRGVGDTDREVCPCEGTEEPHALCMIEWETESGKRKNEAERERGLEIQVLFWKLCKSLIYFWQGKDE